MIGRTVINDTLCFSPPLIITEAEIDEMLTRTEQGIGRTDGAVAARADCRGAVEQDPDASMPNINVIASAAKQSPGEDAPHSREIAPLRSQ